METIENISDIPINAIISTTLEGLFSKAAAIETLRRKELLRPHEVESLFGITRETLTKMRLNGKGPRYTQFKDGGAVYYEPQDIREYITSHKVKTHDQQ